MKERVLQYLWKYRLYDDADLRTTTGDPVTVIDPGLTNTDAGADFFNAKLRIAGTVWAGDIEIHSKASDWIRHGHDRNPAYDSVILHVVGEDDASVCRSNGEVLPQLVLHVPGKVRQSIDWLLSREGAVACSTRIHEVSSPALPVRMDERVAGRAPGAEDGRHLQAAEANEI